MNTIAAMRDAYAGAACRQRKFLGTVANELGEVVKHFVSPAGEVTRVTRPSCPAHAQEARTSLSKKECGWSSRSSTHFGGHDAFAVIEQ
jgi:hypothetical protein